MPQNMVLYDAVVALDLDAARKAAAPLIGSPDGRQSLMQQLRDGINTVHKSYEAGECFLADLLMANFIHRELAAQLLSYRPAAAIPRGTVLVAVVQGDVHDIGKILLTLTLQFAGFQVIDLGVDVSPDGIVRGMLTHAPDVVLLSGTLDISRDSMAATMDAIHKAGLEHIITVGVGGHCVDQTAADEMEVLYCASTGDALRLCRMSTEGRN